MKDEIEVIQMLKSMSNRSVENILKCAGFEILKSNPRGFVASREDPCPDCDDDGNDSSDW